MNIVRGGVLQVSLVENISRVKYNAKLMLGAQLSSLKVSQQISCDVVSRYRVCYTAELGWLKFSSDHRRLFPEIRSKCCTVN